MKEAVVGLVIAHIARKLTWNTNGGGAYFS
jgi:hypothetical protein